MLIFRCILSFLIFLCSWSRLSAETVIGNGGDAIFCEGESGWQLLDYYEGATMMGITYDFGPEHRTWNIVQHLLSRFDRVDKTRAKMYRTIILKMLNTPGIVEYRGHVANFTDATFSIPSHCQMEPVAMQLGRDWRQLHFYFNKEIYRRFDAPNQAMLLLHEAIFAESRIEMGHDHSTATRRLGQSLAQSNFPSSDKGYHDLLRSIGFHYFFIDSFRFQLHDINYDAAGFFRSGRLHASQAYKVMVGGRWWLPKPLSLVGVRTSRSVEFLQIRKKRYLSHDQVKGFIYPEDTLYFHPSGRLKKIHRASHRTFRINVHGVWSSIAPATEITFNKDEELSCFTLLGQTIETCIGSVNSSD